jgi:glycosyltransferase involved in cell wall biosynthesis
VRILILAEEAPDQSDQGDRIRLLQFIRGLTQRHEITLIHFGCSTGETGRTLAVPRLSLSGKLLRAVFYPHLPIAVASRRTGRMKKVLMDLAKKGDYDLLFIYQTKMAAYVSSFTGPVVVDLTDAISLYYSRMAGFCRWPRWLLYRFEQLKMLRFERRLLESGATCVVASEEDARYLRGLAPGTRLAVVPNGVDTEHFALAKENGVSLDLVFVGNMAYPPNRDGVLFFYRQVFPAVLSNCPEARLVVVGKNPAADILALRKDRSVVVTGYVDDVRPYLAGAAVVICPVRFGAGTRIKILEAMAVGRAVVSTAIGCEGLEVTAGEDIMIADDPGEMAAVIVDLLRDREKARRIGLKAAETVRRKYSDKIVGQQLENLLVSEAIRKERSGDMDDIRP